MKPPFYLDISFEKSNCQYFAVVKIKKWALPWLYILVLIKMLFGKIKL